MKKTMIIEVEDNGTIFAKGIWAKKPPILIGDYGTIIDILKIYQEQDRFNRAITRVADAALVSLNSPEALLYFIDCEALVNMNKQDMNCWPSDCCYRMVVICVQHYFLTFYIDNS